MVITNISTILVLQWFSMSAVARNRVGRRQCCPTRLALASARCPFNNLSRIKRLPSKRDGCNRHAGQLSCLLRLLVSLRACGTIIWKVPFSCPPRTAFAYICNMRQGGYAERPPPSSLCGQCVPRVAIIGMANLPMTRIVPVVLIKRKVTRGIDVHEIEIV